MIRKAASRRRFGRHPSSRRHPLAAARWLAVLCSLWVVVASTAQAAHLHLPARPGHHLQAPGTTGNQTVDTEERCPLCVALHPALPVPLAVVPAPVPVKLPGERPAALALAASGWHFACFSRPPPAALAFA